MMSDVYATMPNESDFTPFKRAGMQGFNFAHLGGKFRYHTMTENQANLDHGSIQHHGSYAISLTRHFGNLDLSNLRQDKNPFTQHPWLGSRCLSRSMGASVRHFGRFCFCRSGDTGLRRKKVSLVRLLLGALAFLINTLMSAGIVWLIWQVLVKIYPSTEQLLTFITDSSIGSPSSHLLLPSQVHFTTSFAAISV